MKQTEEVIERINKYLSFVRYQYSLEEQLSRQKILIDFYGVSQQVPEIESYSTNLEIEESLGKDLVLPLKVRGIFLTNGKPKNRYYSEEEIRKSVLNPINNKPFPLMLDHERTKAGKIVGAVDKIEIVENLTTEDGERIGIRWYGHINDETFARNVMDGLITEVSATIFALERYHPEYGKEAYDLTFKELSLVMEGAEKYNSIEIDDS